MPRDEDKVNQIIRKVAEQLGVSEEVVRQKIDAQQWRALATADSLDVVELVMELEEDFGDDLPSP